MLSTKRKAKGTQALCAATFVEWLRQQCKFSGGKLPSFSKILAAEVMGFDLSRLQWSARLRGQVQSRIDYACYQCGLPPIGLASDDPYERGWQATNWVVPTKEMGRAAKERIWSPEDFVGLTQTLAALQSGAAKLWKEEIASSPDKIKFWAYGFVRSEVPTPPHPGLDLTQDSAKPGLPARRETPGPSYELKLAAMRQWLIRVARRGQPVTYSQVMEAFGIDRFSLRYALGKLGRQAHARGEPVLTAMVVKKSTGHCGPGFSADFNIADDAAERAKLYEFWEKHDTDATLPPPTANTVERVARFVSVEARPEQAVFRRRVFEACGGRCVISGCDVLATLDAAHKKGRNWRQHNAAADGYLMRKDLHALYDDGLLMIDAEGIVTLDSSVIAQYGQFIGTKVGSFDRV